MKHTSGGSDFLLCFLINIILNYHLGAPALILLLGHFFFQLPIKWVWVAIAGWFLVVYVDMLILRWLTGSSEYTVDRENKNPYSSNLKNVSFSENQCKSIPVQKLEKLRKAFSLVGVSNATFTNAYQKAKLLINKDRSDVMYELLAQLEKNQWVCRSDNTDSYEDIVSLVKRLTDKQGFCDVSEMLMENCPQDESEINSNIQMVEYISKQVSDWRFFAIDGGGECFYFGIVSDENAEEMGNLLGECYEDFDCYKGRIF